MRKELLSRLHYRIHSLRTLKGTRITCLGLGDGVGSQLHGRISTLLYARRYSIDYIHTPFENLEHLQPGEDAIKKEKQWEQFFNLGENQINKAQITAIPSPLKKPHRTWLRNYRYYWVTHCHRAMQWHAEDYEKFAGEFREGYWKSSKPEIPFLNNDRPYIAVHLRRGDVQYSGPESFRYTSNQKIFTLVNKIAKEHQNCPVHIFSQGNHSDFSEFIDMGAQLHLNEEPMLSFHSLVCAPILVTAKSTFSYTAAMLNTGTVYHEKSWLPPFQNWLAI